MPDPKIVKEILKSLSIETVSELANVEIARLKELFTQYREYHHKVTDQQNANFHSAVIPIREALENSLAALLEWKDERNEPFRNQSDMGIQVSLKIVVIFSKLMELRAFELREMTDRPTNNAFKACPFFPDEMGSMDSKILWPLPHCFSDQRPTEPVDAEKLLLRAIASLDNTKIYVFINDGSLSVKGEEKK